MIKRFFMRMTASWRKHDWDWIGPSPEGSRLPVFYLACEKCNATWNGAFMMSPFRGCKGYKT